MESIKNVNQEPALIEVRMREREKNRKDCMKKARWISWGARYILFYDLIGQ